MKRFLAALQFLTILPLPRRISLSERELAGSVPLFPVVGILIGAAVALADKGFSLLFPVGVASTFAVILLLAVSGGLHTDGLADTADGLFSSRPRERILEIMRDSRTGPMGVVAIVCVVSLKIALIASIEEPFRGWALLLIPVAGRSALVIQMALLTYARPEGLVAIFQQDGSRGRLIWPAAFLVTAGGIAGGFPGIAAGAASFLFALLFSAYVRSRIGGLTGDTLGASCELTELVPALVASACMRGGWA